MGSGRRTLTPSISKMRHNSSISLMAFLTCSVGKRWPPLCSKKGQFFSWVLAFTSTVNLGTHAPSARPTMISYMTVKYSHTNIQIPPLAICIATWYWWMVQQHQLLYNTTASAGSGVATDEWLPSASKWMSWFIGCRFLVTTQMSYPPLKVCKSNNQGMWLWRSTSYR